MPGSAVPGHVFQPHVNGWAEVHGRGLQCQPSPQHPWWVAPHSLGVPLFAGGTTHPSWAELTLAPVGSLESCCATQANQGTSALYLLQRERSTACLARWQFPLLQASSLTEDINSIYLIIQVSLKLVN